MRVLWISSLAWKKDEYLFPVNGPGAVSGSLFQQSIIEGLESLGVEIDIVMDYPYADRKKHTAMAYLHRDQADDLVIPSNPLPYINHITKSIHIASAVRRKINKKKYDLVIAYLVHTPYLQGIKRAKRMAPSIKTILICPDLPDMMDLSLHEKPIKQLLKRMDGTILCGLYRYVDAYILFTEYMQERLPIEKKPYLVLEGVASIDDLDIKPVARQKAIMHAGTLHKNIGIEETLSAMQLLPDEDIELWILGDGELRGVIQQAQKKDNRIKFFGFVDRTMLFEYEKKAAVLISARNPEDRYTRYSFPSKTFEYLYSGTPFLTTQLVGTPKEYDEYCYRLSDNTPESIAAGIQRILQETAASQTEKMNQARQFVEAKKNKYVQAKRLKDFVESILG